MPRDSFRETTVQHNRRTQKSLISRVFPHIRIHSINLENRISHTNSGPSSSAGTPLIRVRREKGCLQNRGSCVPTLDPNFEIIDFHIAADDSTPSGVHAMLRRVCSRRFYAVCRYTLYWDTDGLRPRSVLSRSIAQTFDSGPLAVWWGRCPWWLCS